MKHLFSLPVLAMLFVGCAGGAGQSELYNDYIRQADSLYMAGNYAAASNKFSEAFMLKRHIQDHHLYNGACVAALAGDIDIAFERLQMRIDCAPDWYVDDPMRDNDLQALHTDQRWQQYVETMTARKERIERDYDKPLRAKLQEIAREDQDVRYAYIASLAEGNPQRSDSLLRNMQRVDSVNEVEISHILDSRGWVGRDVVGEACETFWLVIQHSSLESQRRYLPLFREAAERGELAASAVAMMEDRVAMFEGKPQKYGTQLELGDDGKYTPYTLLDEKRVDRWREEVGLEPLDEYIKGMNGRK